MKRLVKKAENLELYHGTSSDTVDSIMNSGLKVVVGGQGDGAYVSSDYDDARKYALKRAGDRKIAAEQYGYEKYKDVYPVLIVVNLESDELTEGYGSNYIAKEGVSPDKIINVEDLTNDHIWQALLNSFDLNISKEERLEYRRQYTSEVFSIV